jgi:hypothetical protein
MSRPARDHHYQADDEKDETDGPQKGHLEEESGDEEDDAENDHGVYLVSMKMCGAV